jgi:hypothetical protein
MAPVEDLGNIVVSRASLSFTHVGAIADRVIRLRAHPVTTPWNPGTVSWTAGWSRPGGDFDDNLYSVVEVDLRRGVGTVALDLTALVKEAVEGGMNTDGFILTVAPGEGIGLPVADLVRFAALGTGSVELSYRKVPLRTRGRARG